MHKLLISYSLKLQCFIKAYHRKLLHVKRVMVILPMLMFWMKMRKVSIAFEYLSCSLLLCIDIIVFCVLPT